MIKITEQNINWVYGMMRKFFYNKKQTGFMTWHNFNCSGKRRIPQLVRMSDGAIFNGREAVPAPESVELIEVEGEKVIRITFTEGLDLTAVRVGSEVEFKSGRMTVKEPWIFENSDFIYEVYQAKVLTNEEKLKYQFRMIDEDMARQEMCRQEEVHNEDEDNEDSNVPWC